MNIDPLPQRTPYEVSPRRYSVSHQMATTAFELPNFRVMQTLGVVHGGAVASLIDTASAFAVVTQLEPNERVTTTDLTIHYLRPVTAGRLTATARTVRAGRRLFVLSVEVMDNQQKLIATAVTTYIKLQ